VHDVADFISAHEPFSDLGEGELRRLAASTEIEFFPAGAMIETRGSPEVVWMVRRGAVELVDGDKPLDLLTEGDVFANPSVLPSLPPGANARAHEDSLCYALPAAEVGLGLSRRRARGIAAGTSDAARGIAQAAEQRARVLATRQPIFCEPETPVREAAARMVAAGTDAILVQAGDKLLGIVTDRDLRAVVAGGQSGDVPARAVMSSPVITAAPDATGAEVMATMLDHDLGHLPVKTSREGVVGLIGTSDLIAAEADAPFVLRRAIAEAMDREAMREAAARLRSAMVAMHRWGLATAQISRVISIVADALITRMIELAVIEHGAPPSRFAWLSLGSHGRREPMPSSDVDSGMAWEGGDAGTYMHAIASEVDDCIEAIEWRLDPHGVTAADRFSASSIEDWRRAIKGWLARPSDERVLIAVSILLDGRVVYGHTELDPTRTLRAEEHRPGLLDCLLRLALASKPPTGFFRDLVVESSGEHRGTLDIKRGGLLPVVEVARYVAVRAGFEGTATTERLEAGVRAGIIEEGQGAVLREAFDLFASLRLEHQVDQIEDGVAPDDHLDPRHLSPLARRHIREAFRELAAIQRSLAHLLTETR
jgi:CBS domain-containing protein